jgi:hypothetical protein
LEVKERVREPFQLECELIGADHAALGGFRVGT